MLHQPQVLSPLPEVSPQSSESSNIRGRKMSTSGNRSWSEEEENYLLQTRMQKMPYKHIAAHLKKTELACRLHYHQLSHGSHRRRRASSLSPVASSCTPIAPSSFAQAAEPSNYGHASRHGSPMYYHGSSPSMLDHSQPRAQPKILLPKPRAPAPSETPKPYTGLRLNTNVAYQPKVIDTDRLRCIYEARRTQFWSAVAAEYGADVSPVQLEDIWRNGNHVILPPTPDASPGGSSNSMAHSPSLDTSFIPPHPAMRFSEPSKHYKPSPSTSIGSAAPAPAPAPVLAHDRSSYILPIPALSHGRRPRAETWSSSPRDTMPIASLLNEE